MKTALVNLNRCTSPYVSPYALDILGTSLEDKGHEVEVLDLTLSEDTAESIDAFFEDDFDLVGLSLRNALDYDFHSFLRDPQSINFMEEHKKLVERIKQRVPLDKLVVGGSGFSIAPDRFLGYLGLEKGVHGPGEQVLPTLSSRVQRITRGSGLQQKVKRSFVNNKGYYERGGTGPVRTNYGCNMRCAYCVEPSVAGRLAKRAIDFALDEIDQLVEQGVNDIQIVNSELNLPFPLAKEFLRAVEERSYPDHVRFWGYCQPKPFDEEFTQLLVAANFKGISFGTVHTDDVVLKNLQKGYRFDDIRKSSRLCRDSGLLYNHDMIFGYVGDSSEKMVKAVREMISLEPDTLTLSVGFLVLPNTALDHFYSERSSDEGFLSREGSSAVFYVSPLLAVDYAFATIEVLGEHHSNVIFHHSSIGDSPGPTWYKFLQSLKQGERQLDI